MIWAAIAGAPVAAVVRPLMSSPGTDPSSAAALCPANGAMLPGSHCHAPQHWRWSGHAGELGWTPHPRAAALTYTLRREWCALHRRFNPLDCLGARNTKGWPHSAQHEAQTSCLTSRMSEVT